MEATTLSLVMGLLTMECCYGSKSATGMEATCKGMYVGKSSVNSSSLPNLKMVKDLLFPNENIHSPFGVASITICVHISHTCLKRIVIGFM